MPAVDFYFDFRTPYSYLANTQLRSIGVESHWAACKNGQIRMRHIAKETRTRRIDRRWTYER